MLYDERALYRNQQPTGMGRSGTRTCLYCHPLQFLKWVIAPHNPREWGGPLATSQTVLVLPEASPLESLLI